MGHAAEAILLSEESDEEEEKQLEEAQEEDQREEEDKEERERERTGLKGRQLVKVKKPKRAHMKTE